MNKSLLVILVFISSLVFGQKDQTYQSDGVYFDYDKTANRIVESVNFQSEIYPLAFESAPIFHKLYQNDAPYSFAKPEAELLDKRDASSKHFLNKDGKITSVLSAGQVHYLENGLWKTILNDFHTVSKSGFQYGAEHNSFKTYMGNSFQEGFEVNYANGKTLNIMQGTYMVTLDVDKNEIAGTKVNFNGNISDVKNEYMTYSNLSNGISALIENNSTGYTLDYEVESLNDLPTLNSNTEYIAFVEKISFDTDKNNFHLDNGRILFQNERNEEVLVYNKPVVYPKIYKNVNSLNLTEEYIVKKSGNDFYVYILMKKEWLQDPDFVFPIIVDPTVTLIPNNAVTWTYTIQEDGDCEQDDNMKVGFFDGTFGNEYYQTYSKYNTTSIPDANCIQSAFVSYFQHDFENDQSDDNALEFHFQALDPVGTDPVTTSCAADDTNIDGTTTWYRRYNVFGNCGGTCTDYNESNNQWKNFPDNVGARVQLGLVQNFIAFSLDNIVTGHSDPTFGCGFLGLGVCDNDDYLQFRGHSNTNRPRIVVVHEAPSTVPTSITVAPNNTVCSGTSVTLTRVGGSLGTAATWEWYTGSCGGTSVGSGNSITVTPTANTTYFVRAEGICNTTTCVSTTINVNTASTAPTSIIGTTSICNGGSTTLTLNGSLGSGATWEWYSGSCGGASVGSGTSITVSPAVTTTYFVRGEGPCVTTACASVTVTVNTNSTAPGSITASLTTLCAGTATTLSVNGGSLGTAATWEWYTTSCGGTAVGSGSSISVSPTSTTTYFIRAEGTCNTTTCASQVITVNTFSTAPTSISTTSDTLCTGGTSTLSVIGGTLGTASTWEWYSVSCGGVSVGSGNSISVSPTSSTTYFVRAEGTCNTTTCASTQVTVSGFPSEPLSSDVEQCQNIPVVLTASGSGGTLNWYLTNISTPSIATGPTLNVGVLSTGTHYRYISETNSFGCESSRNEVEIIIKPTPSDAPAAVDATICPGASVSLLASNPGGAAVPATNFNWYNSITLTSVLSTGAIYNTPNLFTPPTTHTFFVAGTLDGCFGPLSVVTVDFYQADLPIVSNDTSICNGDMITLMASAVGSTEIRWYANSDLSGYIQSGTSYTTPALNSNTTYYVTAVYGNGCESQAEPVMVSINPLALSPILTDEMYCENEDVILNATNISGTLTWYSDAALTTSVGTSSPLNIGVQAVGTYNYFAQVNNGTCESVVIANTVEVEANPAGPVLTPQTICVGESATLTVVSTDNVNWYADAALSNLLFVGSSFTTPTLSSNTTYWVMNSNMNCASATGSVLVTVNPKPTAPTTSNVTICKNATAILTAMGAGGTYTWYTDAALANQVFVGTTYTTPVLNSNTSYFLTEDNGLCTSDATQVDVLVNLDIDIVIDSEIDVLCFGDNNGTINTTVSGGNGTYTYSWTGGSMNEDLIGAMAGNYVLTVTDGLGCMASNNGSISSPDVLDVSLDAVQDVTCNGMSDGGISVFVSGGTSAYSYSWNDGTSVVSTSINLVGQSSGTYTLTVTDANLCTATLTATINENAVLDAIISTSNVLCFGGVSSASVAVTGGQNPYTYLWSNFDNTNTASNLSSGTISVVVTDANGCSFEGFETITSPAAPLEIEEIAHTDVTCFNGNDGLINTNITGGTMPYTISWSPGGANVPGISNLSAGIYTITVTDTNNCVASASYEIQNALEIIATMAVTNPTCFGEETGMIVVGNSGGTAPYTYAWNTTPAQSGVVAVNLAGDATYDVLITDINGCTKTESTMVVYPVEMTVITIPTSVSCISDANGSVSVVVTNGNAPFQYELNSFLQSDSVFDNLDDGNYVVFVEDNNNCTASASFSINSVSGMEAELEGAGNDLNFVTDNLFIVRGEEVSFNVNLINDNGNPIVGYNWNPVSIDPSASLSSPSFTPDETVIVVVEVLEDINGSICTVFDTLHINVSQERLVFVPTAFTPNSSGANNFFEVNVLGAKNLSVSVFNRWGEVVFSNPTQGNGPSNINDLSLMDNTNPRGAWDGTQNGEDVPTGAYAYSIEVTYFDDTKEVISGSVTVIR